MKQLFAKQQPLWGNLRWGGRYFFTVLLTLLLLSAVGSDALAGYVIQIDFFYDTQAMPERQIAGYRLYREGNLECQSDPVEPQHIECTATSITETSSYTLSAFFTDGYESPQSAPFDFSPQLFLAMKGLQVLTGQSPSGISDIGVLAGGVAIDLPDIIHLLRQSAAL